MAVSSKVLGLIPAKGGSQRLPRKNILDFAGKPLIQWAAEAAWDSGVVDDLILSTDDDEIAQLGISFGLEVPFMRPPELGRDPAGVEQVALHALDEMARRNHDYSTLIILLPTSPLRTANHVRGAFEAYQSFGAANLLSVTESEHSPFTAMQRVAGDQLEPVFPDHAKKPTQALPATYRPNGAVHVLDVDNFRRTKSYLAAPMHAYVMPRECAVDIDRREDLDYAEFILHQARMERLPFKGPN